MVGLILCSRTFVLFGFFFLGLFNSFVLPFSNLICNMRSVFGKIWCSHWLLHFVEYQNHQGAYVVVAISFSSKNLFEMTTTLSSFVFFHNIFGCGFIAMHEHLLIRGSLIDMLYGTRKGNCFFLSFISVWFLFPIKSKAKVTDLKYYYKYCLKHGA